ncbi:hypothetical protein LTR56_010544 [Elasticomyces elasticus]|nr:hypothetical protein LTR56_010544 [Elasticomyces elasticus]KAK3657960.1 hypothetical protein LTR22_009187 [Elasticomyces elasticus]KAK5762867.1 hypothetical protein LTS12_007056 [Elasticomyces elasticus]
MQREASPRALGASNLIYLATNSQGILAPYAICYHNGILMAAMHCSWLRGSYEEVEPTYIFHKLEMIRAVNKAISEPAPLAKIGIVESIDALSMTEAGIGDTASSDVHLDGLLAVYEHADPGDRQRYQVYRQISEPLMLMIGTFMAAARKVGSKDEIVLNFHQRSDTADVGRESGPEDLPSSTPAHNQYSTPSLVPNSSAAWASAAYLYLNLLFFDGEWIPGGYGNPSLLRWLLDWTRVKLDHRLEAATRSYTGELWLWRVVVGAYALTVVGSRSAVDIADECALDGSEGQREMLKLVEWYAEQLTSHHRATWVPKWESAQAVLEKIQWLQTPRS